jgi:hypothetical protein
MLEHVVWYASTDVLENMLPPSSTLKTSIFKVTAIRTSNLTQKTIMNTTVQQHLLVQELRNKYHQTDDDKTFVPQANYTDRATAACRRS